ncbi:MAG: RNA polymerase factor sigma-54 [Acidobacteriaceae bacterium]|nr:RNA polymerase factor sigma-54 [Acidobacteriaceae bacterium]
MSSLSQRLHLGVQQKQILTPGLVQMVTVLQLNRLELKDMIRNEIAENPVLEEAADAVEELTPEEVQALLERERQAEPADQAILDSVGPTEALQAFDAPSDGDIAQDGASAEVALETGAAPVAPEEPPKSEPDPFDEIDFDSYWDNYLDPGFRSPASESVEKPSFETFLSSPVTLSDYLQSQLSVLILPDSARQAANSIIGNLEESGYLTTPLEEIAVAEGLTLDDVRAGLKAVQSLDPTGVGASSLRECLLLQLEARGSRDSVAWKIIHDHLKLLETRQLSQLAKVLGRPPEHIKIAVYVIRHLDPAPGLRHSTAGARQVEPDVYISKEGDDYLITLNDDEIPQLRLNGEYKRMIDREQEPNKDVRNYVKERYASALQLIKNIEQRKQTILRVCQSIIRRQTEFLEYGIDHLKTMRIKEVAEEIGVHPSTVSRAVANKYSHTPQGVFELRYFFSEAVQGPSGSATPLLIVKRRVKKMIEDENAAHPLTDEQITARLQSEGIQVTRRTVAKYREDMKIPSTHQRRIRA